MTEDHIEIDTASIINPFLYASIYLNGDMRTCYDAVLEMASHFRARQISPDIQSGSIGEWIYVASETEFNRVRFYAAQSGRASNEHVRSDYVIQIMQITDCNETRESWKKFRERLSVVYSDLFDPQRGKSKNLLFGYSLWYGGEYLKEITIGKYKLPGDWTSSLQSFRDKDGFVRPIKQMTVSSTAWRTTDHSTDALVMLLNLPDYHATDPSSIYLAVSRSETIADFNYFWYENANGVLTEVDLLSHKTSIQAFNFETRRDQIEPLIDSVIAASIRINSNTILAEVSEHIKELKLLWNDFGQLLGSLPLQEAIRISLQQQLANCELISQRALASPVIAYLYEKIRIEAANSQLFVNKTKAVSDSVKLTLDYIKSLQTERETKELNAIQSTLTWFGLFFSLLGVITPDLMQSLPQLTSIPEVNRFTLVAILTVVIKYILSAIVKKRRPTK